MDFEDGNRAGSVTALRAGNVALLRPVEQVFDDMLTGWSAQQVSRMLNEDDRGALSQVRRFAGFCGSLPWEWSPADVEEWTTELVSGDKPCSHGTIRSYQNAVALFCDYLTDRRYGWIERCEELFGTHPVQVCPSGTPRSTPAITRHARWSRNAVAGRGKASSTTPRRSRRPCLHARKEAG